MRISFDLDDTLICYQPGVPAEAPLALWPIRAWLSEPLRLGARELLRELVAQGHTVGVYTTSYRDPQKVRLWLMSYGVRASFAYNQAHYDHLCKQRGHARLSKDPRLFNIDLHVDNEIIVAEQGEKYGFAVVLVAPEDTGWADRVREAINAAVSG
jgi:FMN phosphatase YigB (HAD superfamily)